MQIHVSNMGYKVSFLMCSKGTFSYTRIKHGIESFFSHVQQRDYIRYTYQTWDRKYIFSCAVKWQLQIHVSSFFYHVQKRDYFIYTYQTWDRKYLLSRATKGLFPIKKSFPRCSEVTITYSYVKHGIDSFFPHVQWSDSFKYTYQACDRQFLFSCAVKTKLCQHISNMG